MNHNIRPNRRTFVKGLSYSAALMTIPGFFPDELSKTPALDEGPFYPNKLPLDTDNDLLLINDRLTPAVGTITHLAGKILDVKGNPIRNATVEIWQVDNNGSYIHTESDNRNSRDKSFQGYGRFLTGSKGEYYFRTIKPVAYTGRTPHIHFAINQNGNRLLSTQMLIAGEPSNKDDPLFSQIVEKKLRNRLLAEFNPLEGSRLGECTANFDLVVGLTPAEK